MIFVKNFGFLPISYIEREENMAKIIESSTNSRRQILLSSYDVINVVRNYQYLTKGIKDSEEILDKINENYFYLPEDF